MPSSFCFHLISHVTLSCIDTASRTFMPNEMNVVSKSSDLRFSTINECKLFH